MFDDYKIAYFRDNVKIREAKPLSFIRQSVGYMLSHSARSIPHAGGVTTIDVTPLIDYTTESYKTMVQRPGETPEQFRLRKAVRKNYSAFFLKAIAHSLHKNPSMNACLDYRRWRSGGVLYVAEDVNIGYTVHTKFGVIKPIIHNAHEKELTTVADEMRLLTRKARKTDANELYQRAALAYIRASLKQLNFSELSGMWMLLRSFLWQRPKTDPGYANVSEEEKLQVKDILGVTCTLANIGMSASGNQTVTVITPPEVFMIGLGDIHPEPLVVDGQVVPRQVIRMFVTFDHRAFDAGEMFPLVATLMQYIHNPEKIYEWNHGDEI